MCGFTQPLKINRNTLYYLFQVSLQFWLLQLETLYEEVMNIEQTVELRGKFSKLLIVWTQSMRVYGLIAWNEFQKWKRFHDVHNTYLYRFFFLAVNIKFKNHRSNKICPFQKLCINLFCRISIISHLTLMPPKKLLSPNSLISLQSFQDLSSTNSFRRIRLSCPSLTSMLSVLVSPSTGFMGMLVFWNTIQWMTNPIPSSAFDLKSYYHLLASNLWFIHWEKQSNDELRKTKSKSSFWTPFSRFNRREEVFSSHLRIKLTRLIHS